MKSVKGLIALCGALTLTNALAQPPAGMSEEQMQQMMQGALQMAGCMQNIDQNKVQGMVDEGKALEKELRLLCSNGEQDEAQTKAMLFGQKIAASPEFKQLHQCGEMARQMMPQMPDYTAYTDPASESYGKRHICDEFTGN